MTVRTCCYEPVIVAGDPSTAHTRSCWLRGSALVSMWEGSVAEDTKACDAALRVATAF